MSIITISRGSYNRGKEVAELVAKRLGYECVGREVILQASKEFDVPEIKLIRAIHDAPSILERFTYGKEKYVAFIQAALLKRVQKDNVVYHGLAGQFFLKDIGHVLKVRILSDMENRVRLEMEREGISHAEALRLLKKDDEERRKWSLHLYGIDSADPALYDLVLNIRHLTVEAAVDVICTTVGHKLFQTTPASQHALDELVVGATVKAALVEFKPDVVVTVRNGVAYLKTKVVNSQEKEQLVRIAECVPGVQSASIESQDIALYGR